MEGEKHNASLNITFHNPNTSEEMSKFLIKLVAQNVVEYIDKDRMNVQNRTLQK